MFRFLILLIIIFPSCQGKIYENKQQALGLRASVYESEFGGFGFDIYIKDKLTIHQPSIPVFEGKKGFPSEESALKAAQLMIEKILSNQMPPSLSESEVISLL